MWSMRYLPYARVLISLVGRTILGRMAYAALKSPESIVERVRMRDGLALAVETFGCSGRPAIVFAHGFGQTRGDRKSVV